MNKRSAISFVMVFLLIMLCATSAYAASYTYAISNGNYSWLQGPNPTWTSNTLHLDGDDDQIDFEGTATSPTSGEFKVRLEKNERILGFIDNWVQKGNIYTTKQHSNRTFNSRTGQYVNGQYFKQYWHSFGDGDYRVVLYSPTKPQSTGLTGVYFYAVEH